MSMVLNMRVLLRLAEGLIALRLVVCGGADTASGSCGSQRLSAESPRVAGLAGAVPWPWPSPSGRAHRPTDHRHCRRPARQESWPFPWPSPLGRGSSSDEPTSWAGLAGALALACLCLWAGLIIRRIIVIGRFGHRHRPASWQEPWPWPWPSPFGRLIVAIAVISHLGHGLLGSLCLAWAHGWCREGLSAAMSGRG